MILSALKVLVEFSFSPEYYSGTYNIFVGFENKKTKLKETFGFTKFISRITVKCGATTIEKISQIKTGDKLTVSLDVENTEHKNYNGIVFCAQYNGTNLIDIKMADIVYDNKESQSVSFDFVVGEINDESVLKVMFWEQEVLIPLMSVYEIAK